jgi:sugar/nucleoside kinase (ribokinase family)
MARVVVVGSVASDDVVRLAERMREGAHLNGRLSATRLGGGGANTAVALAAAGHRVSLVAAIGDDATGAWQLEELRAAGVDTSAVAVVPGPSTRSILMVDPAGERTIVNLGRVTEAQPPHRLCDLPADLVYVRARHVDGLAPLLIEAAARAMVVAHVPPVTDGGFPAHVVLGSASDLDAGYLDDPVAAAARVAGPLMRWSVVTRGPGGAEARSTAGERHRQAARAVRAIDSTGAGDAFAAGLCHALAGGCAMPEALAVAVRWGSEKVMHDGSALSAAVVQGLLTAKG